MSKISELTVLIIGPVTSFPSTSLETIYGVRLYILEDVHYLTTDEYEIRFSEFLRNKNFDHIIIEYLHNSYLLSALPENWSGTILLDAHDIISQRQDDFKKYGFKDSMPLLDRKLEMDIFASYDKVIVLCRPDMEALLSHMKPEKVLYCPHPVDIVHHDHKEDVTNITFIASSYTPNIDGITFFLKECWPVIAEAKPGIYLNIYGTVVNALPQSVTDRVIYHGFKADLNEIYVEADIVINPVRFGAGAKIKNIEALAYGLPLVTTTHGGRGMEQLFNQSFLIADDALAFTEAVLNLTENAGLREKLSCNAIEFLSLEQSENSCFSTLRDVIQA